MRLFKNILLPIAAIVFSLTSCSVPDMRVNENFKAEASAMPVQGRSAMRLSMGKEKGFGFGAYQVEDVKRGWTRSSDNGQENLLRVSEAYQRYSFGVIDTVTRKTLFVQAAAMLNTTAVEAAGWSFNLDKQREFLQVAFRSAESGEWRLSLADPGNYMQRTNFEGSLKNKEYEIEVLPLYKWEGKSLPSDKPLGYEFSRGGQVLATVQTVNSGKVWLRNSLSPDLQMVLASASASLLLYNQLDQENQ
ncbi:hypothetical protein [Rufibacter roseus]|uniref:Lipoprotein n=1 Tax=Rufibacter roseus TaxID=1567108 RepID=A0ABW2DGY9_9BACT|nr:hypothetical protein [Rufibacter roseus]